MNYVLGLLYTLSFCGLLHAQTMSGYEMKAGKISKEALQNYLAHSITQAEFLASDGFYNDGPYPYKEDDVRMLKNVGAKFIGRAVYSWGKEEIFESSEFWNNGRELIREMHAADADMIFQAAIFEIVTKKVNRLPIPDWVFKAFNMPIENRSFNYEQMLNEDGVFVDHWGKGSSVPDISRLETQLYFYYLASRYMQMGIEAIHFGQAELIGMNDWKQGFRAWQSLLAKVRKAAKKYARRGTVLCDAHLPHGGIAVNGQLLFDFVSFPLRLKEIPDKPQEVKLELGYLDGIYGKTIGGITPSGWPCERSLYLVEFDNFGISKHPDMANIEDHYAWGYDEISWLAKQDSTYGKAFLNYAQQWLADHDPIGFLEMPGSRIITGLHMNRYRANTQSERCPVGGGLEETIKKILSSKKN